MSVVSSIVYEGKEIDGTVNSLTERLNYILKEVTILEVLEKIFSDFITSSTKPLIAKDAFIFLDRFKARKLGQEFFFIEFSPSLEERRELNFIQKAIASGNLLSKELILMPPDKPAYLKEKVIPVIIDLFKKYGFEITKRY